MILSNPRPLAFGPRCRQILPLERTPLSLFQPGASNQQHDGQGNGTGIRLNSMPEKRGHNPTSHWKSPTSVAKGRSNPDWEWHSKIRSWRSIERDGERHDYTPDQHAPYGLSISQTDCQHTRADLPRLC
ncbi:hypothetical protein AC578_1773 [Pseudocercospora eumusae]|uniref:Uncharacterized protein n=1 Tax=Pseudocercospora eumusae TaxID=321146 RepID=A0A139H7N4_9PEZI|nr:hypothetical protein AC578_1773 [Pseudocercospora eumusae]